MLKMDRGRVTAVYNSGLIDVRLLSSDLFFERIIPSNPEVEENDQVLVFYDGNKAYAVAQMNPLKIDDSGNSTINDVDNDLADLSGEKSLTSSDEFGNRSRVIVSRGGGVLLDTGEFCVQHLDPGHNTINSYCERYSKYSLPVFAEETHDGDNCSSVYKWRTEVDPPSLDRDLQDLEDKSLDKGVTVNMKISAQSPIEAALCKNGIEFVEYSIDENGNTKYKNSSGNLEAELVSGSINITSSREQKFKAGLSTVELKPSGEIEILTPNGKILVDQLGKLHLGNKQLNLLFILSELLMVQLAAAQTVTSLGPQPLIPVTAGAPAIQALLNLIKK